MILAELEVYHSRPIAPTRRIALGDRHLPVDPPPNFGGLLLAGVVATFAPDLDEDLFGDLATLIRQVGRDQRIAQPRLRHRYQGDRVGLTRLSHRLIGAGEQLRFEIDPAAATPTQHVLGAVYATAELRADHRGRVAGALQAAMSWQGPLDPGFVAAVTGRAHDGGFEPALLADPGGWARQVLGITLDEELTPTLVKERFRKRLRLAHPDHGAGADGAARRVGDLMEARRILLR